MPDVRRLHRPQSGRRPRWEGPQSERRGTSIATREVVVRSVARVEREEARVFDPSIAAVVEHDATPHTLSTTHTHHFTDDRRRTGVRAETRFRAQGAGLSDHAEVAPRESIAEREAGDDD